MSQKKEADIIARLDAARGARWLAARRHFDLMLYPSLMLDRPGRRDASIALERANADFLQAQADYDDAGLDLLDLG